MTETSTADKAVTTWTTRAVSVHECLNAEVRELLTGARAVRDSQARDAWFTDNQKRDREDYIRVAFLRSLLECSKSQKVWRGAGLVMRFIDRLLRHGHFREVDNVFSYADVSRLDPEISLAFLTITSTAKGKLDAKIRVEFIRKAKIQFCKTRDADYVDKLFVPYS